MKNALLLKIHNNNTNKKTIIGEIIFVVLVGMWIIPSSLESIEKCSQTKSSYEADLKLAQEEYGFETYDEYIDDIWAKGHYIVFVSCSLFA